MIFFCVLVDEDIIHIHHRMLDMSYTVSSADGGNISKNHQNSAAKDFRNSSGDISAKDSKDAGLQPDGDFHDFDSYQQGQHTIFRRVWHWSVRNITVIALVCLVMGGLVSILVSFGGWFPPAHSWIRTEIAQHYTIKSLQSLH